LRVPRRLSRRRFLGAAAGAVAAAIIGCGEGREEASPAPILGGGQPPARGGVLRLPGFEAAVLDTLDPHQTQFGPIYSAHSSIFSKVLRYEDILQGVITTDLAQAMPEVVGDPPLEYVVRLRPGVRFHRPSQLLGGTPTREESLVGGRELTAEDVKFSLERQMNESSPRRPWYYRAYQYKVIERIEVVDRYTLRIVLKEPTAPFLHFLADTNAFVVPREVVDRNDEMNRQEAMIGTGPFVWAGLKVLETARFVRNPEWFGWGQPELGRPYLDGYVSIFAPDDALMEAAFRQKQLDAVLYYANPKWVLQLRSEYPELQAVDAGFSAWVNIRLVVDRPPFNDPRLRRAIHLATDRQQIIDAFWQGWGRFHGPVNPMLHWALPEQELLSRPGYRTGPGREEDMREARRLYEAAGRPPLEVTFSNLPPYIGEYAPIYQRHLQTVLGAAVTVRVVPQHELAEGHLRGTLPFTFAYDNGWIDLDDWTYPYFHSRGTKNSFRLSDPQLDRLLEAQRREFVLERRRQLGWEIQRYLLDHVLARIDLVTPINLWVAWPYYRNFRPYVFFGTSYQLVDAWLDPSHPSFRGRPSG
jgi:peptide/nickel transport system substrate-binding protein